MENNLDTKQLLKILIGAAWIDGVIQAEERNYLHRMATNNNLADDPEIKILLSEIKPVQPAECYKWLENYLGNNPTQNDYQGLLEAISELIYSDGDVETREAKLLAKVQLLDPSQESSTSAFDKILKTIQKLYRRENNLDTKQLLKILIGAAWIDGVIQAEERNYLHRMATNNNLADDPEIKILLSEIKPVQPAECYKWLENYLGNNPTQNDYQGLLEAISGLIYSDGDVETREAKLLAKVQLLDPSQESSKSAFDKILKTIQKLYRQAISEQV